MDNTDKRSQSCISLILVVAILPLTCLTVLWHQFFSDHKHVDYKYVFKYFDTDQHNHTFIFKKNYTVNSTNNTINKSIHGYETCTAYNSPRWSNPSINNLWFGILYFARVPKTGSRTWLYRIHQICDMSRRFNENDKFYTFKADIDYQMTFVAANKYQKFAKFPIKYDEIVLFMKEFLEKLYIPYLALNIKNIVKNDNKTKNDENILLLNFKNHITTYIHFVFVDYDVLTQAWFDAIKQMLMTKINIDEKIKLWHGKIIDIGKNMDDVIQILKYFLRNNITIFPNANTDMNIDRNKNTIDISEDKKSKFLLTQKNVDNGIIPRQIEFDYSKLQITWIIYLRDPVKHQMSRFDFWRSMTENQGTGLAMYESYQLHPEIVNLTLDKCVEKVEWLYDVTLLNTSEQLRIGWSDDNDDNDDDQVFNKYLRNPCYLSFNYFTKWLCGTGKECQKLKLDEKSLNKAIYNLNKYFEFVGIVEYYEESWKFLKLKFFPLLETRKPIDLGDGGNSFSRGKHAHLQRLNKTHEKLAKWSNLDVQLYNYAKKRFQTCILPVVATAPAQIDNLQRDS